MQQNNVYTPLIFFTIEMVFYHTNDITNTERSLNENVVS